MNPPTGPAARAQDRLALAAAPTFAVMALLTSIGGEGIPDRLCSATQHGSALTGMVAMYVLMSVFHSSPWLALIARRRRAGGHRVSGSSS